MAIMGRSGAAEAVRHRLRDNDVHRGTGTAIIAHGSSLARCSRLPEGVLGSPLVGAFASRGFLEKCHGDHAVGTMQHCASDDMKADVFTKSFVEVPKWEHAISLIGLSR